jgi:hypothetical protein
MISRKRVVDMIMIFILVWGLIMIFVPLIGAING